MKQEMQSANAIILLISLVKNTHYGTKNLPERISIRHLFPLIDIVELQRSRYKIITETFQFKELKLSILATAQNGTYRICANNLKLLQRKPNARQTATIQFLKAIAPKFFLRNVYVDFCTLTFGQCSFKYRETPVMVPPVPTPITTISTLPPKE